MSYFYTFAQTWAIKRKCGKIRILKELKKTHDQSLKEEKKTVNREYYAIERNSLPCMERYLITNQNFLLTPSHMNWNQKRVVLCHWGTLFGCRYRSMNKTAEISGGIVNSDIYVFCKQEIYIPYLWSALKHEVKGLLRNYFDVKVNSRMWSNWS